MRIIKVQFEVNSKELPTEYFDVGLRCQDNNEMIRGHKVFLAAVSPRLEELFDEHGEGDDEAAGVFSPWPWIGRCSIWS